MRDVNNPDSEFANFAIEAANFLSMYPEYILTEAEKKAFLGDQHGCIVGRALAEQFNWKAGDTVELTSNIYRTGKPFEFVISAIYQTDQTRYPGTNESTLFLHYKYLDETTGRKAGVRTYRVEIADPQEAGVISHAIDDLFENSDAQTHTETEAQYRAMPASSAEFTPVTEWDRAGCYVYPPVGHRKHHEYGGTRRRTEIGVLKTLGFWPTCAGVDPGRRGLARCKRRGSGAASRPFSRRYTARCPRHRRFGPQIP
jgi:putative ABC transport system permease protein